MTEREKILGDLFRESLHSPNTPSMLETFGKTIMQNFSSEDFLFLQMASQFQESAKIRKRAKEYMKLVSIMSSQCFKMIENFHPNIYFCTSQRFKSAKSEIYKRYERLQEGLSPEIKDLTAIRIILFEPETLETLKLEYIIAQEIMENFSTLNAVPSFPIYVNLSIPDKVVDKSSFSQDKYPEVILPSSEIIIPGLYKLGKDYIQFPKESGYQSFHISFEVVSKSDSTFRIFTEVQIRTIAQHQFAEFGPAKHSSYKEARERKMQKIFYFNDADVGIIGYSPSSKKNSFTTAELDYSGFVKPILATEVGKTF